LVGEGLGFPDIFPLFVCGCVIPSSFSEFHHLVCPPPVGNFGTVSFLFSVLKLFFLTHSLSFGNKKTARRFLPLSGVPRPDLLSHWIFVCFFLPRSLFVQIPPLSSYFSPFPHLNSLFLSCLVEVRYREWFPPPLP